jgi:hypothetical protein
MRLPGFAAESSVYRSHNRYQARRLPATAEHAGKIVPSACRTVEFRTRRTIGVLCVEGDCFPNVVWETQLGEVCDPGGGDGEFEGEQGPGGGGLGGGAGPTDGGGTRNMDRACSRAASKCLIPTTATARCAVLRCQKGYCKDNECTSDEQDKANEAKDEYDVIECDLFPCRKRPSASQQIPPGGHLP